MTAEEIEAFERKWLTYINSQPRLISLLYDCDLLPEQTMNSPKDKRRMFTIAIHLKALLDNIT